MIAEAAISEYAVGSVTSVQDYMIENEKMTETDVNKWFKKNAKAIEKTKKELSDLVIALVKSHKYKKPITFCVGCKKIFGFEEDTKKTTCQHCGADEIWM